MKMAVFTTLSTGDFNKIKNLRGYREQRLLISLYMPRDTPIASILVELKHEIQRIERRKQQSDGERNSLVSLMKELIADLKTTVTDTGRAGLVVFYGLDSKNNLVKYKHVPENNSAVSDFLLVCDRIFYLDTILSNDD